MADPDEWERALAASRPNDDLDSEVALVEFLRESGIDAPRLRVGEFEIERRIGKGGFGQVYAAIQPRLGRRVALKLLHPHRLEAGQATRLQHEASALAKLNHPNVVQIHQVAESSRGTFIAMELVEGVSLEAWQQGRPWAEILGAYLQAGEGLAAAHARGILHLDFTPRNVLVGDDGRVRVVDFGLARGPGVNRTTSTSDEASPETEREPLGTRPVGGTAGYASPEQVLGRRVDRRSDQFSFCVTLHEALYGTRPYTSAELATLARRPEQVGPPAVLHARGPRRIRKVLARGLSASSDDRWPSMQALLAALRHVPWYRRNTTLALLGVVNVAAIFGAVVLWSQRDACGDAGGGLERTWDDQQRQAVLTALGGSRLPYSEAVGATVVRTLDRYAVEWSDASTEACEQDAQRAITPEEHVRRRGCLYRGRDRLGNVVAMLSSGDDASIEHADELLSELPSPGSCAHALVGVDERSRSQDPRSPELLRELDRARLQLAVGRLEQAGELAAQVDAAESSDPAVRAETRLTRGLVLDEQGRDEEAIEQLQEGIALAIEAGRDDLAAQGWGRLARVSAHDLDRIEPAREWARLQAAAVRRLGSPASLQADQLDGEGELLRLSGDPKAAERAHRAALVQLAADRRAPDDPRWISTWQLLAHARADQPDGASEAATLYDRALALATSRTGPQSPQVARLLESRALVAIDSGHPEAADGDLERAYEILVASHGPDSPELVVAMTKRAEVALQLGRIDQAAELGQRAWALQREHLRPGHVMRGSALVVLAQVELARRNWSAALEAHERVDHERRAVATPGDRAMLDINLGWLSCRVGRCAEARAPAERVLQSGDETQRAYAESIVGQVELAAGRAELARVRFETTLRMVAALPEPILDLTAEAEWQLARTRLALGEPAAEVLPMVEHSLGLYRELGSDPEAVADLESLRQQLTTPGALR